MSCEGVFTVLSALSRGLVLAIKGVHGWGYPGTIMYAGLHYRGCHWWEAGVGIAPVLLLDQ